MSSVPVFWTVRNAETVSPGIMLVKVINDAVGWSVFIVRVPDEKVLAGFVVVAVNVANVPAPTVDVTAPRTNRVRRIFFAIVRLLGNYISLLSEPARFFQRSLMRWQDLILAATIFNIEPVSDAKRSEPPYLAIQRCIG